MTSDKISLIRDACVLKFIDMSLLKYVYFVFEFTILMCAQVCRRSWMLIHGVTENRMSFLQKLQIPDFVGSNGRAKTELSRPLEDSGIGFMKEFSADESGRA